MPAEAQVPLEQVALGHRRSPTKRSPQRVHPYTQWSVDRTRDAASASAMGWAPISRPARRARLALGLAPLAGLLTGGLTPLVGALTGLLAGVLAGVPLPIALGGPSWPSYWWGTWRAVRRGLLPGRLVGFLDWCLARGLMRMSGTAIQFRHRIFQERLAADGP